MVSTPRRNLRMLIHLASAIAAAGAGAGHPDAAFSYLSGSLPLAAGAPGAALAPEDRQQQMRQELSRMEGELKKLSESAHGVLGELDRLDALIRLRKAEIASIDSQVESLESRLSSAEKERAELESEEAQSAARLRSRLRSLYMEGRARNTRLILASSNPGELLWAVRRAVAITEADGELVDRVRSTRDALDLSRSRLQRERDELLAARSAAQEARRDLEKARGGKERILSTLRLDQSAHAGAMDELQRASSELSDLAKGLSSGGRGSPMDFGRFQGVLRWPCSGAVTAGFGRIENRRFRTAVPHDGLDIAAAEGEDIHAVFDGRVAFAGWLTGYGLTLMLDHGGGYLSVYAHASALLVEKGEPVVSGQVVAKAGDTGSLSGPLLYFEIRKNGQPLDPSLWLKRR